MINETICLVRKIFSKKNSKSDGSFGEYTVSGTSVRAGFGKDHKSNLAVVGPYE